MKYSVTMRRPAAVQSSAAVPRCPAVTPAHRAQCQLSSAYPRTHLHARDLARNTLCRAEADTSPKRAPDDLGDLAEKIEAVAKSVDEGLQGTSIFLVGMMGSGKSTVGKMLANVLQYCFFDSDAVIQQAAGGASIADIFAENGEETFREIETSVLRELSAYKNCVIATGGGAATRSSNWGSMNCGVTVFLDGPAELLARRIVTREGTSSRPLLAGNGDGNGDGDSDELAATTAKLQALLDQRQAKYAAADCTVSIKGEGPLGASAAQTVYRVLLTVDQKIKQSAAEREERKKFEIQYEGDIPVGDNMQVREAYSPGEGMQK